MIKNIRFERITKDRGLSNKAVHSILQDKKGFIWIGTMEGLNKFDGDKFQVFKKDDKNVNSIPNNYIQSLHTDSYDNLWIGMANMELAIYDCFTDKFRRIVLSSKNFHQPVSCITGDGNGDLWVGTYGSGLFKIKDFQIEKHIHKNNFSKNTINCDFINTLFFDKTANTLYIGTLTGGINILNLNNESMSYFIENADCEKALSCNSIKGIFRDSRNNLWVSTHNGLNRYEESSGKFIKYFHDPADQNSLSNDVLMGICEDREGLIWIGTRNHGVNVFSYDENKFMNFRYEKNNSYSLSGDAVISIFADRTGVLWIGTFGEGLCKADRLQKKFYNHINCDSDENNLNANRITSIYFDSGNNLWLGTRSDGMYSAHIENGSMKSEKFKQIDKKSINCIVEDRNKTIWISSQQKGLCSYNLLNGYFEIYKHDEYDFETERIFPILIDKLNENILWIGSDNFGLLKFDLETKKFYDKSVIHPELNNITIFSLYQNDEGILWVGTNGKGLYSIDTTNPLNAQNLNLKEDNGAASQNSIWCITEDKLKNLWLGTSNGLFKYIYSENKFLCFTEADGLANNNVFGILFDNSGELWLSTNNGISKFNPGTGRFKNYNFSDGITADDFHSFSYYRTADNTMYFGSSNGITYFTPSEIEDNPNIPEIAVTDFEIFNEKVNPNPERPFLKKNISYADEINLTYRESVFSFKFAALIFNNPQKNQYAYKMEGFDKDWTYSGNRRRVTYTNLDHGEYIFRVKGSNNDGVWNEEGTSIKITISPPYWKTWWFKGLSALSLIAATGYSYRQRLEKLEKESKAQEEFSRKLIDVQENEKKRIAHELHDTIAHDVLISKQKAMMALKHKNDIPRLEKALEEISELSSTTISEVRNIAYNLHPHQLERLGFTKTIKSIINEVSKSTDLNFVFETDNVDNIISKESEINLFRVVQECISNIIKHSGATEVILKVSKTIENIIILIIDNGRGFEVGSKEYTEARSGYGLSGILERIKYMNGDIKIDSELGKGTTLKFIIPIK